MSTPIDISKFNKGDVLAAIYNHSQPLGMGFLHYTPQDMTREEAEVLLKQGGAEPYFDYLKGRVMKVRIFGDTLEPRLYDRDNGEDAAARALATLTPIS